MSPDSHYISDHKSENQVVRRGRPPTATIRMLEAADTLFAQADGPERVTMDAIAAACSVGKGTLFRAFGSRAGLLDALWTTKIDALRESVESGAPPFRQDTLPQQRLAAFLDLILTFKLDNRHLIRALEFGPGILQSPHYRWMLGVTERFIEEGTGSPTEGATLYTAHTLLAALHIDLIEDMLSNGLSLDTIREAQARRAYMATGIAATDYKTLVRT
ncbi:TetR/AcrR family transcriptional regulator [Gluconobacter wancherniae]|uniref:TetR family transcriptional regulator n=1 Tax=Gluconobacter wancherniae NBRC 103581 TaxID=656744 RepID=A0A511AXU4_9PROT|nr:TetR/AcrR family transcriptional regulator [Gluconobacter wancherniae]GBD56072.1 nucleoid occlusion factor SlmA [Gluconobacter wancherniae NBRC 103581]GEK93028.1 TetR family transcriptional regulator [Gluconobacter wancherniae NBRC 103581]